jgi:prolyl-tRNA editing enzyme YbaK/EbsC (Cys-tRNA(Pro) deacylase)
MSIGTPATRALSQAGVICRVLEYDYVSSSDRIGLQAAEAIGLDPGQVLKTLMVRSRRSACLRGDPVSSNAVHEAGGGRIRG